MFLVLVGLWVLDLSFLWRCEGAGSPAWGRSDAISDSSFFIVAFISSLSASRTSIRSSKFSRALLAFLLDLHDSNMMIPPATINMKLSEMKLAPVSIAFASESGRTRVLDFLSALVSPVLDAVSSSAFV